MDRLSAIAASGMRARMQELDILANNLANSSSRGFKADRELYSLYTSASASDEKGTVTQSHPWIKGTWVDFSQGAVEPTGNPSDVALVGKGFLSVQGTAGTLYTRDGNLSLTANGELVASEGRAVLDAGGSPIRINPKQTYQIDAKGRVSQNGKRVAQLAVVEFSDPEKLVKYGKSFFHNPSTTNQAKPAVSTTVHQGQLEESNAGPAEAAVRLVSVMREFEMLQKAVALGAEMDKQAVAEVAKVSP